MCSSDLHQPEEDVLLQRNVLRVGVEQQATKEIPVDLQQLHLEGPEPLQARADGTPLLTAALAVAFIQFLEQQINLQLSAPVFPRHADEDLPQQVPHDAARVHESPDRHEDRNLPVLANLAKNPLEHMGFARPRLPQNQAGKGQGGIPPLRPQKLVDMFDDGTVEGVDIGVGVVSGIGGRGRGEGVVLDQLGANIATIQISALQISALRIARAAAQPIHVIVPILKPFSSRKPSST